MFHQFSSWWRALSVVLLGLATLTWPSAAQATTTPSFSVLSESSTASLNATGAGVFSLRLKVPSSGVNDLTLSLFPRIVYRSEVTSLGEGVGPSSSAIATTSLRPSRCQSGTVLDVNVSVFSLDGTGTSQHCANQPLHLRLPCTVANCDGVYPLAISVTIAGVRRLEWSMLAVRATPVLQPLQVDLIPVVDPLAWASASTSEANFTAIAHAGALPLTIATDYRPLSRSLLSSSGLSWRRALANSLTSAEHRVIVAPPSSVDFAGLAANGFSGEVARQVNLDTQLLRSVSGRYSDGPVYLEGAPSGSALAALVRAGFKEFVLPDSAFSPTPSTTLGWGEPFNVTGVSGAVALATDSGLQQLTENSAIEPGRRVAMTLAELAFLHFEAPNARSVRTVVLPLNTGSLSPVFLSELLSVSQSNPFFTPSTLSESFSGSLIGADDSPASRQLVPVAPSPWSSGNVAALSRLLSRTNSYLQAIASPSQTVALESYSAQAEQLGSPAARQGAIESAESYLDQQLRSFRIDDSAITLTGSGNDLPITLFSTASYPVTVVLRFITDRLSFTKNQNPQAVTLATSTKSLRIPVTNRQGQSLTLQVELTTPDGKIELAHAAIQVRVAGASIVGYLLSGASLFVLAWWWLRTFRRKSQGRHAR